MSSISAASSAASAASVAAANYNPVDVLQGESCGERSPGGVDGDSDGFVQVSSEEGMNELPKIQVGMGGTTVTPARTPSDTKHSIQVLSQGYSPEFLRELGLSPNYSCSLSSSSSADAFSGVALSSDFVPSPSSSSLAPSPSFSSPSSFNHSSSFLSSSSSAGAFSAVVLNSDSSMVSPSSPFSSSSSSSSFALSPSSFSYSSSSSYSSYSSSSAAAEAIGRRPVSNESPSAYQNNNEEVDGDECSRRITDCTQRAIEMSVTGSIYAADIISKGVTLGIDSAQRVVNHIGEGNSLGLAASVVGLCVFGPAGFIGSAFIWWGTAWYLNSSNVAAAQQDNNVDHASNTSPSLRSEKSEDSKEEEIEDKWREHASNLALYLECDWDGLKDVDSKNYLAFVSEALGIDIRLFEKVWTSQSPTERKNNFLNLITNENLKAIFREEIFGN